MKHRSLCKRDGLLACALLLPLTAVGCGEHSTSTTTSVATNSGDQARAESPDATASTAGAPSVDASADAATTTTASAPDASSAPAPTGFAPLDQLAQGAVQPGCFAWSDSQRTAACLTLATSMNTGGEVALVFVGEHPDRVVLASASDGHFEAPLTGDQGAAANDLRAAADRLHAGSYQPWSPPAGSALASGGHVTESGVTLARRRRQTDAGGDNQPPSFADTVSVQCGHRQVALSLPERTFGNHLGSVNDRVVGLPSGAVVLLGSGEWGQEGDVGTWSDVLRVDPAAVCARR